MDAGGLLRSQGWRGLGHTLHATDDKTGLARPLLISRKEDRLGLGSQSVHSQAAATDQWWLDAFDQQLKGLNPKATSASVPTTGPTRLEMLSGGTGANKYRGAYGLYAHFVRGDIIEGTVPTSTTNSPALSSSQGEVSTGTTTPEVEILIPDSGHKRDKKRKREGNDEATEKRPKSEEKEKKGTKRAKAGSEAHDAKENGRKEGDEDRKRRKKEKGKKSSQADATDSAISEKDSKRVAKAAKKARKARKLLATGREATETKSERKARKRAERAALGETKEERRARRDAKKKRREEKRAAKAAKKSKSEA